MLSGLVTLIIVLIVLGVVFWLIDLLPIDATIKQIIRGLCIIVVVIFILIFLLSLLGVVSLPAMHLR